MVQSSLFILYCSCCLYNYATEYGHTDNLPDVVKCCFHFLALFPPASDQRIYKYLSKFSGKTRNRKKKCFTFKTCFQFSKSSGLLLIPNIREYTMRNASRIGIPEIVFGA